MGVREDQKAVTRTKMLEKAQELFTAFGYEGVSIRDLAKAIDMSTGAVFGQCPGGKDDLWEAAMGSQPPSIRAVGNAVMDTVEAALSEPERMEAALLEISLQMSRLTRALYGELTT